MRYIVKNLFCYICGCIRRLPDGCHLPPPLSLPPLPPPPIRPLPLANCVGVILGNIPIAEEPFVLPLHRILHIPRRIVHSQLVSVVLLPWLPL